jgi:hypothetical protein
MWGWVATLLWYKRHQISNVEFNKRRILKASAADTLRSYPVLNPFGK